MKVNFSLPNTKLCIVITIRGDQRAEHLIDTPPNNDALRQRMLERKFGFSEIKAVKAVEPAGLVSLMTML